MQASTVEYTNHLVLTQDQMQADEEHGIFESRRHSVTINEQEKTFTYNEHYVYVYERMYEEVTNRKKKTQLTGQFKAEGNQFVATVAGSYEHFIKEDSQVKTNVDKAKVEGTMIFEIAGDKLKVVEVKLKQNGVQFQTYFSGTMTLIRK